MPFRIETAVPADIAAMHAVRMAVRENRLSDPALVTEQSYRRHVEAGSAWIAVEDDRHVIGFAILDAADASVWALFVHPDREGAGLGRALHDRLLEGARRHGMRALRLTTAPGTRAVSFYLKQGWERTGVSPTGEVRFERSL